MRKIYIDRWYNIPFLIKHGKEVKEVTISKGTNILGLNTMSLHYLPNIENIICESDVYKFTDGVLYGNVYNKYRDIYYVTKGVKELKVDADIHYIWSLNDLENIIVDKDNEYFTVIDNMLLNIEKTRLEYVFSNSKTAIVPEGVTDISYEAFKDCRNIEKIVFPSTYKWHDELIINDNVKNLKVEIYGSEAKIENDIVILYPGETYAKPVLYIGDSDRCIIPDGIKFPFISGKLFKKVKYFEVTASNPNYVSVDGIILDKTGKELVLYPPGRDYLTIPDTVEIIKKHAVYNTNLREITIPENVKTIEDCSFECINLKRVHTLNPDVDVQGWGDECESLEKIKGVVYFGNTAGVIDTQYSNEIRLREGTTVMTGTPSDAGFVHVFGKPKYKIEKLFLPSSLKKIEGCINDPYKEIIVDENNQTFRSIEGVLFSKNLKTLIRYPVNKEGDFYHVPDGVESISEAAFHNCRNIKHVVLPDSVRRIGHNAFSYSMLLSIEMKAQPTEICELAIKPVRYLRYSGKVTDFATKMVFRFGTLKIPVLIENNWKENNDEIKLSDFIESDSVLSKKNCFLSVNNAQYKKFMALYLYMTDKDEDCREYLSRTKKKIVEDAFYDEFLNSVKQDEDWAFLFEKNKAGKKQIKKTSKEAVLSKWALNYLDDGTYVIEKYKGKDTVIEVPETYKGVPITAIGKSAFSGKRVASCKNIEKVIISGEIKAIGDSAFEYCVKLEEIVLPDSLITIGEAAFGYTGISSIVIPNSVTNIGSEAFNRCEKLKSITFGDSVKIIGGSAFYGCPFVEVSLPDSVESIGMFAFNSCKELRKIKMPAKLKYIGMSAFGYCESLESLYIPKDTVIEESSSAFRGCYKLNNFSVDSENERYTDVDGVLFDKTKKVLVYYPNGKGTTYEVPAGTEVIGEFAFEGCRNIISVYLPNSVKVIGFKSFDHCYNLTVYSQKGSYAEDFCRKYYIPIIISQDQ